MTSLAAAPAAGPPAAAPLRPTSRPALLAGLGLLATIAAFLSLWVGPAHLPFAVVLDGLLGRGDPVMVSVVRDLRLPRAILGLLVGAMLGLAGAALQGYLRNPLADPAVLGASNAAALGAVGALYFGLSEAQPLALPLLAIGGALLALLPLLALSGRSESQLTLVLAGIAVGTLAGAGISLTLNLSPNPFAAMEITSWLLGSLADRDMHHVALAAPCLVAGAALLLWDARSLDALSLGEEAASTLGVQLPALRPRLLLGVALGVGGAVAVSGAVGFVGLIAPHLVRPATDRSPSAVLLPSALAGAALLAAADALVRVIPTSAELKLGVVTAFLGVPVFAVQLLKARRLW